MKLLTKVTVVTVGFQQLPVRLDTSIHTCCSLTHALAPAAGLSKVKTLNTNCATNTYSTHVNDPAVRQVNDVNPCTLLRDPQHFFT